MSKTEKNKIRNELVRLENNLCVAIREGKIDTEEVKHIFQDYSELFSRYKQETDRYAERLHVWGEVDPLVRVDLERAEVVQNYQIAQVIVTKYLQQFHQRTTKYQIESLLTTSRQERSEPPEERHDNALQNYAGALSKEADALNSSQTRVMETEQITQRPKHDIKKEIDQVVQDLENTYMEAKSRQIEIYKRLSLPQPQIQSTQVGAQRVTGSVRSMTSLEREREDEEKRKWGHPQHRSTPKEELTATHHDQQTEYYSQEEEDDCSQHSLDSSRSHIKSPFAHTYQPQDGRREHERAESPQWREPPYQSTPQRPRNDVALGARRPLDPGQGSRQEQEPIYPERLHTRRERVMLSPKMEVMSREHQTYVIPECQVSTGQVHGAGGARRDRVFRDNNDRHLERLSVPVFKGDPKRFFTFWGGFSRMVDSRQDISAEVKMLRLEKALQGDAVWVLDGLSCGDGAYAIAKSRLMQTYGGEERQINIRIAELRKLRPVREDNYEDLQRLASMLEAMIDVMTTGGNVADLNSSTLYNLIKEKLPAQGIIRYNRWVTEHNLAKNVETIKIYISEETAHLTDAVETHKPVPATPANRQKPRDRRPSRESGRSLHVQEDSTAAASGDANQRTRKCRLCSEQHWLYQCDKFKGLSVMDRWTKVSKLYLCFKCLGSGHRAAECKWGRPCGTQGCTQRHHRLLHRTETESRETPKLPPPGAGSAKTEAGDKKPLRKPRVEVTATGDVREDTSLVVQTPRGWNVALRIVPVLLRAGNKRLPVNALLDDGSTRTYVNQRVADFLGIDGPSQAANIGRGRTSPASWSL